MRKHLLFALIAIMTIASLSGCASATFGGESSAIPTPSTDTEPNVLAGQIVSIDDSVITLAVGVLKAPSGKTPSGTARPHPTGLGKPPTRDDVTSVAPSESPENNRDSVFELTGETIALTVTSDTVITSCSGASALKDLAVGNIVSYTADPFGTALTITCCFGRKPA